MGKSIVVYTVDFKNHNDKRIRTCLFFKKDDECVKFSEYFCKVMHQNSEIVEHKFSSEDEFTSWRSNHVTDMW